jgi:NTP pyrophosphatase (non-canonical NTP hydrolase)
MKFSDYQTRATDTDRLAILGSDPRSVALLGLAGETGSVHTLYKKLMRDGDEFPGFREKVKEELGDILWYLTAIASHEQISLEEIATENLQKTSSRWLPTDEDDRVEFDEHFPPSEQLPREFIAEFKENTSDGNSRIEVFVDGNKWGASLTDNSYTEDGYRFHDVFHMTCVAMLGWSPVVRALMQKKRKSDPGIDEVEDGGRAIVVDEALAAVVFSYAIRHNFLKNIQTLDWQLLGMCQELTLGLEVGKRSSYEWERTILGAFSMWRTLQERGGGRIRFDMTNRYVEFVS